MDTGTRFWSKVDVRSQDECWEWIGIDRGFKMDGIGQNIKRVAWVLTFGEVPEGYRVYSHKPNCVNPSHLFLAKRADAWRKMLSGQKGENHPRAILTRRTVERIRNLKDRCSITELAREYGVSPGCIADIQKHRNWK